MVTNFYHPNRAGGDCLSGLYMEPVLLILIMDLDMLNQFKQYLIPMTIFRVENIPAILHSSAQSLLSAQKSTT